MNEDKTGDSPNKGFLNCCFQTEGCKTPIIQAVQMGSVQKSQTNGQKRISAVPRIINTDQTSFSERPDVNKRLLV